MPTLMQRGATWLGDKLKAAAGRSVTITQGATSFTITAAVEQHEHEVIDESGFLMRVLSFDWLVVAADLAGVTLRSGAEIVETLDGVEQRYETMTIGKKPCVELLDTSGILLTVHSKRVGVGT